ncbi:MAG: hypothetical protein R2704_18580 [Microthrixaceae bacterium]
MVASPDSTRPQPDGDRPSHPMGASLIVVGGVTLLIIVLAALSAF